MSGQSNVAPIIIKKKKINKGDGHHGGAWKVAYADFVTAMMAFFMMMWLLNATTEQQRRGLADYFSPTVPISRQSAGGEGMLMGNSVFAEQQLAQNGIGATNMRPTEAQQARGEIGEEGRSADQANEDMLQEVQDALARRSGESAVSDEILQHIVTRVTDEGLVVEIFDVEGRPLFIRDSDHSTRFLREVTEAVAEVTALVPNNIAISGHVRTNPIVRVDNPVWSLSANRADRVRSLLEAQALPNDRVRRMTGHADRTLATENPLDIRNNRIEIIYLRE